MNATHQDGTSSGTDSASTLNAHAGHADAREKLISDMKNVISEAEDWLGSTTEQGSDKLSAVKQQFDTTLQTAKTDLLKLEATALARAKLAAQATDVYVKDNPWKAVSLGAAIGVIAGLLIARAQ